MNLAIVIGVSKYNNFNNLPQCKKDAKIMYDILKESEKYDDILYIYQNTTSGNILNIEIDNFVKKYVKQNINEILFYFSGHGLTKNNEFYYVTSNTDEDRINSTSISNNNLDTLVKSLNPNLFVKIIDACESGTAYVKGTLDRSKILEREDKYFNNCYFFSSSQNSQKSYIQKENVLSDFTYGLVSIIKEKFKSGISEIKYRDISNELADFFDKKSQTPFFVLQGSLSEVFLPNKSNIIDKLENEISLIDNSEVINNKNEINSITEESAIDFKNKLMVSLENKLKRNSKVLKDNLYQVELSYGDDYLIPRSKICNWIIDNKEKYFVFAETVTKKRLKGNAYLKFVHDSEDYEYKTDDFKVSVDKNSYQVTFEYTSQNNAFPKIKCHIICLYSLTKIYLFYTLGTSVPDSWSSYSDYKSDGNVKYKVINIDSNDNNEILKEISDEVKNYADAYITKYLEAIY